MAVACARGAHAHCGVRARDRQDRGPRREGRRDFKERGGEPREWIDPKERRGGQADPNSPFAKLAALKEQLEASKER